MHIHQNNHSNQALPQNEVNLEFLVSSGKEVSFEKFPEIVLFESRIEALENLARTK